MSEETWHGIPRIKIPRGPTINCEKCVTCGKCVDYGKLGVYEFEENRAKRYPLSKIRTTASFYAVAVNPNAQQAQSPTLPR